MNFITDIKTEYTAERVIFFDGKKQQFVLSYNVGKLNYYSLIFFIIGIFFSVLILPNISKAWWLTLIVFAFLALPFLLFGFRYLRMSFSNSKIIIDLNKQTIYYSNTLQIPFRSIKQIYLTQLNYYDPERAGKYIFSMKKISSWQLTIEDYAGNTVILCKPERKGLAKHLLKEFSRAMNVPMKEEIEIV